jgi:hypothetical protein
MYCLNFLISIILPKVDPQFNNRQVYQKFFLIEINQVLRN